jgi:hypothetical protein
MGFAEAKGKREEALEASSLDRGTTGKFDYFS